MHSMESRQSEFIKLIQENKGIINKIIYLYADSSEAKNDLKQEILAESWKSFPNFEGRSKFSTWLYRIGLNVAFANLRKLDKQTYVDLEKNHIENAKVHQLEGKELLNAILKVLQPIEKSIVLLLIEGYNQKEIAELLGLSAVNVRVKVSRLRKKLEQYGFKNIA